MNDGEGRPSSCCERSAILVASWSWLRESRPGRAGVPGGSRCPQLGCGPADCAGDPLTVRTFRGPAPRSRQTGPRCLDRSPAVSQRRRAACPSCPHPLARARNPSEPPSRWCETPAGAASLGQSCQGLGARRHSRSEGRARGGCCAACQAPERAVRTREPPGTFVATLGRLSLSLADYRPAAGAGPCGVSPADRADHEVLPDDPAQCLGGVVPLLIGAVLPGLSAATIALQQEHSMTVGAYLRELRWEQRGALNWSSPPAVPQPDIGCRSSAFGHSTKCEGRSTSRRAVGRLSSARRTARRHAPTRRSGASNGLTQRPSPGHTVNLTREPSILPPSAEGSRVSM